MCMCMLIYGEYIIVIAFSFYNHEAISSYFS